MELLIVIFAAIAAWAAGSVYYMVLAGPRLRVSGVAVDNTGRPERRSAAPYLISGLAMVVCAGMIRHVFVLAAIHDAPRGLAYGAGIGAFIVLPWIAVNHAHAQRSPLLVAIDSAYAILACAIIGLVLGAT